MDDRQQPARDETSPNRSAPGAAGKEEQSPNGRPDRHGGDPSVADRRSSPDKPPLTERERRERWPLG
jgi:hypothetical protein